MKTCEAKKILSKVQDNIGDLYKIKNEIMKEESKLNGVTIEQIDHSISNLKDIIDYCTLIINPEYSYNNVLSKIENMLNEFLAKHSITMTEDVINDVKNIITNIQAKQFYKENKKFDLFSILME